MPIRGNLEEASIPDVLQLLSLGQKSGCLSVTDWTSLGYIFVESGRITFATIVNRRDRLGDVLLKSGRITAEQLDDAIRAQGRDRAKKLGEILTEIGAISREELERHMRVQIEEAVYFLFTWRRGNFTFESGILPENQDFVVSIDPESLLLEGARRTDEWSLIEKKVPSFGIVFKLDRAQFEASGTELSGEQKRLAVLLDGTRDVGDLVDQTGLGEFDVGKALYGLVTAGLAHPVAQKETDMRLSASGVRIDGDAKSEGRSVERTPHLDYAGLLNYLSREGDFADPNRRRMAAFHIADCASCSKRLKEIHKRRAEEATKEPEEQPDAELETPTAEGDADAERRCGLDRRQSDSRIDSAERRTGVDRRSSDERVGPPPRREEAGGSRGPRHSAVRQLVSKDRRAGTDRRCWHERRRAERRVRDRRRPVSAVDRSSKVAVERRSGRDRRLAERRIDTRRQADQIARASGSGTSWAAIARRLSASVSRAPGQSASEDASERPAQRRTPVDGRPRMKGSAPKPSAGSLNEGPRKTEPGTPTRTEARTSGTGDVPFVTKEQTASLRAVPEAQASTETDDSSPADETVGKGPRVTMPGSRGPVLLESERKSLAGLPLLDVPGMEVPTPKEESEGAVTAPPPPRDETLPPTTERRGDEARRPETPVPTSPKPKPAPRPRPHAAQPQRLADTTPSKQRMGLWRPVAIAAAAIVAVALGWYGRPVAMSLFSGGPGEEPAAAGGDIALATPTAEPVQAAIPDLPVREHVGGASEDSLVTPPAVTIVSEARDAAPEPSPTRRVAERVSDAAQISRAAEEVPPRTQPPAEPPVTEPDTTIPLAVPPTQTDPAVTRLVGTVRASGTGALLSGVWISVLGTEFTTTTDGSGAFEIVELPAGRLTVGVQLSGYVSSRQAVVTDSGSTVSLDIALSSPPSPLEVDDDLNEGQWTTTDRATAEDLLGRGIAVIPGLWVESIAIPASGSRPRVRISVLTQAGERVVLIEARSGPANRAGQSRVTALRVIPPTEAYPITTGTASFGNLLVTAKTVLPADSLRVHLGRLSEPLR